MAYLLDSDILIDHFAELPAATQLVERLAPTGIAVSIISYMEIYEGILRSPDRPSAEAKFAAFMEATPILPFSPTTARTCALLRDQLRRDGKRVRARALDLLTAAIAIEHGLTLVTRNVHDYDDISGLTLYPQSQLW